MREIWTWLQIAFVTIGGGISWYLGRFDGLLYALIAFTVIDYIIGTARYALVEKKLSSKCLFKKGVQKLLIFVLVGIANIVDNQVVGSGHAFRGVVIFFYMSSEGVSILEHVAALGLPIPEKLLNILQELHDNDPDRNTNYRKKKPPDGGGQ